MIIDIPNRIYWNHFTTNQNPYISEWFIEIVERKAERIVLLMNNADKSIGLAAGIKDNIIYSPFSAPFGGFHYSHEHLMYDAILNFLNELKEYVVLNSLSGINITLPPDIYQTNMNAKLIHAFIKSGYVMNTPNIYNWIDLALFDGIWVYNKVSNRCRRAIKNGLSFHFLTETEEDEKTDAYNLIKQNRIGKGRKIHMSFEEVKEINSRIPVDFFIVKDKTTSTIGAGIIYRGNSNIAQAIFMGDDLDKRDLGTIDFLYMNIYNHYKNMSYKHIDFGISSFNGEPNMGLIRFKEIHNCNTSLQYSFRWSPDLDLN